MMLTPKVLETITLSHMFTPAIREQAGTMESTFSHYRNDIHHTYIENVAQEPPYWRRVLQKTGGGIICVSGVDLKVESDGSNRNIKGSTEM